MVFRQLPAHMDWNEGQQTCPKPDVWRFKLSCLGASQPSHSFHLLKNSCFQKKNIFSLVGFKGNRSLLDIFLFFPGASANGRVGVCFFGLFGVKGRYLPWGYSETPRFGAPGWHHVLCGHREILQPREGGGTGATHRSA